MSSTKFASIDMKKKVYPRSLIQKITGMIKFIMNTISFEELSEILTGVFDNGNGGFYCKCFSEDTEVRIRQFMFVGMVKSEYAIIAKVSIIPKNGNADDAKVKAVHIASSDMSVYGGDLGAPIRILPGEYLAFSFENVPDEFEEIRVRYEQELVE